MARTDEAEAFYYAVYNAIQEIPYGKVTSYAHIARLVGTRKSLVLHQLSHGAHECSTTERMSQVILFSARFRTSNV
jgi:alkylated DNA nucleotide flippase Atl1